MTELGEKSKTATNRNSINIGKVNYAFKIEEKIGSALSMINYSGVFKVEASDKGFTDELKNNVIVIKQLNIFLNAIKSIPKDYYSFMLEDETPNPQHKGTLSDKNRLIISHVERVFAYELYHRWSCRLCGDKDGWVINGEVGKHLKWFYGNDDNGNLKYPDLVLHKGQLYHDIYDQMIVCEIKRKDNVKSGIVDDLNKLYQFTCKPTDSPKEPKRNEGRFFCPFICGAYVITNVEKKENDNVNLADIINYLVSQKQLLKFKLEEPDNDLKKILFFISNWDVNGNYTLTYQTLYNILLQRNATKREKFD